MDSRFHRSRRAPASEVAEEARELSKKTEYVATNLGYRRQSDGFEMDRNKALSPLRQLVYKRRGL
ncbi:MAG: hypothetical protein R3C68_06100 [Myxococcota bacterium]